MRTHPVLFTALMLIASVAVPQDTGAAAGDASRQPGATRDVPDPVTSPGGTGDRHDVRPGGASTSTVMPEDPDLAELTTETFIQKAAASGMKEVRAAEVALRQAHAEQVKDFARAMIAAHSRQNSRLSTLAAQDNIQLPNDLPSEQREEVERLSGRTGAAFDAAYAQQMRSDHQQALVLFQSCARSMRVSAEVRTFCTTQLPSLQEHQQQARMLDQQSNTTRSAASDE